MKLFVRKLSLISLSVVMPISSSPTLHHPRGVPLGAVCQRVLGQAAQGRLQFAADGGQFRHADEELVVLEEVGELAGVHIHVHWFEFKYGIRFIGF